MDRTLLTNRIRAEAYARGFDLAGVVSLGPADSADAFDRWLERGYDGDMAYLARGAAKRRDPRLVMEGARTAVVVGLEYGGREPSGPVARYARGADYHDLMTDRLNDLLEAIRAITTVTVTGRPYVDTGPMLERDLARRAGLGWFGKNTNLIHPELGSFFFIGALVLDLDLEPDEPFEADRCGTCTRCIDACPTDALVEPRVLDARRCISYLTIELRTAIPLELREPIGELIYGCDICQDVCPWNVRFSRPLAEPAFETRKALGGRDPRTLARELLTMSDDGFRAEFQGSPMKRAKLRGLKRNAAVVLGNVGNSDDVDLLTRALDDPEELVREHAAWALGRIADRGAART
jgi:epoxyqueuosine reductase